ncbi:MAG: SDR family NAD(P)-dependent oxidoreductase, partial [Chloroflexi bacterium]|nr:SDR family NAD(P)-dependent oxidoreductase [Chloroflexota bacterium]
MKITRKTAVIAGGSSGIGFGIAQALAQRGAHHIVLLARTQSKLDCAAAKLRQTGTAISTYSVDLGKPEEVTAV